MLGRVQQPLKPALWVVVVVTVALAAVAPFSARQSAAQDEPVPRDVLILLDTTPSMVGEGGTPNIWADVQQRVVSLLQQEDPDAWVSIAPFAIGITIVADAGSLTTTDALESRIT